MDQMFMFKLKNIFFYDYDNYNNVNDIGICSNG